jgi:hypothetical protein
MGSVALILQGKPVLGPASRNQVGGNEAGSSGSHGSHALYQGTTLVGPHSSSKIGALAPGPFLCLLAEKRRALLRIISGQVFRAGCALAGAKARFF